jgi:hypothetical protein
MRTFLQTIAACFIATMLLFPTGSHANNNEVIIEVPDIATLKVQGVSPDLVYRITGEVIVTHLQTAYRGQFYIQDATGALLVDDAPGVIETDYELYDGITGFTGKLGMFQDMFQFLPTEDPGEASSTGNDLEPLEITLDEITLDHQGMLVLLKNASFDLDESPPVFTHNQSYYLFDDSGTGEMRTPNFPNLLDYFGANVPATPRDIIAVLHQRYDVLRILPRSLADMGITDMHNIAALKNQAADNATVYTLNSEAILTFQQSFRNQKYIEDASAGILIDDNPGVITTTFNIYDGITGLKGKLSEYGNMLQFVPVENPGPATSANNEITPPVITMDEFLNNFMNYQSRLVTIENVSFPAAGTDFANGQVYEFTDGEHTASFRTTFYGVDYIGDPIPAGALHITGLPNSRSDGDYLTARHWADFEAQTFYSVTFNFIDENNEAIEDASLDFQGETLTAAPYIFPQVPVGSHPFTVSKEGYQTKQGTASVVDQDVTLEVVLVAVDPNMITEFPWVEDFPGEEFPPLGWSRHSLGDAGEWELDGGWAHHTFTPQGQEANSWLISPQIQIPEESIMLMSFLERNQLMAEYGYSGVMVSTGSGNPVHNEFQEVYESNVAITEQAEALINLADYAGKVVYLAFVYQGEYAHRWWVDDITIDFAPEAIEVADIAALKAQGVSPDLVYRITGEVIVTHLQIAYRGQFYIQDASGALLVDDAPGVIETAYELYDGITGFTGKLGMFQDMIQILPEEDPGEASSKDNDVEPMEITLADITADHQGMLVLLKSVSFDLEESPPVFTHNESYYVFDDSGTGEMRTPNSEDLLDYFGTEVPDTPKDIIAVLHQRYEVVRILPRMLADFMEPSSVPHISFGNLSVYPNPATSHIVIESHEVDVDLVRMYNINGQLAKKTLGSINGHTRLDVQDLNQGLYLLQVITGNQVYSSKLLISR